MIVHDGFTPRFHEGAAATEPAGTNDAGVPDVFRQDADALRCGRVDAAGARAAAFRKVLRLRQRSSAPDEARRGL